MSKVRDFFSDPQRAKRFIQISGMMGSDQPGERSTAAQHASQMLREFGLTWAEVISNDASKDTGFDIFAQRQIRQAENMRAVAEKKLRLCQEASKALQDKNNALQRANMDFLARIRDLEMELSGAKAAMAKMGVVPAPASNGGLKPGQTKFQAELNAVIDKIEGELELNNWEEGFCASLREQKYKMTPKQWQCLREICLKAGFEPEIGPI